MHVITSKSQIEERRLKWRAAILLAAGVIVALFAFFWILVGSMRLFASVQQGDRIIGALMVAIGGICPGILATILVLKSVLDLRLLWRFEPLAEEADELDDPIIAMPTSQHLGSLSYGGAAAPEQAADELSDSDIDVRDTMIYVDDGLLPIQCVSSLAQTMIGVLLNNTYQIEDLLGEGGMCAVYVARHIRTNRRYAVKALLKGSRHSEDAIRRFTREAAAASALGHRGIVAIYDFNKTDEGVHYLVSELLRGETVEERLVREGAIPWAEASEIVCEVGEALGAAHEANILHRDLKPGNIFLADEPDGGVRTVLLDFGLAKPLNEVGCSKITTSGTVVGTPLYMSPEQACSEHLDVRSDVYSLGAVLYELISGAPPFLAYTIAAVYNRLLREEPEPLSKAARYPLPSNDIDDLIVRALAKNPEERFQSARALVSALGEIKRKETGRPVTTLKRVV